MKVLQINSICGHGSTGKIVSDLHDVLTTQHHECKIAYGLGPINDKNGRDEFYFGNRTDYYVHNFCSRFTDRAGFYSHQQTKKLISCIKEYKPNLIHLHNIHGYYLNIEMLFNTLKTINVPVVWTIHDCWPFTGHCAHYSNNNCYKWKTLCEQCQAKARYPKSYFISQAKRNFLDKKRIFNGVNTLYITTPSDWLREQVQQSFLSNYPVITVHNGIDLNTFKPTTSDVKKRLGITDKKMLLGVSSAWIPEKGLHDFIELSKLLDDTYKIVLVGITERPNQLPENIIALPTVHDQHELAELYTAADIYISFSVEETFGLPTVEAMACGTPVLTYDKTALPEPVTADVGIVVTAHDVNAAYQAIKSFPMLDKEQIVSVASKYDKRIKYQEFIDLYNSLIKKES